MIGRRCAVERGIQCTLGAIAPAVGLRIQIAKLARRIP